MNRPIALLLIRTFISAGFIGLTGCGKKEPPPPFIPSPLPTVETNKVQKPTRTKPRPVKKVARTDEELLEEFKANWTEATMGDLLNQAVKDKVSWRLLRAFIKISAELNPLMTADWAAFQLDRGGNRSFALRAAMNLAVQKDPEGALEWAYNLPVANGREGALRSVFSSWAALDPMAAAEQIQPMQDFISRPMAMIQIAFQMALQDAGQATEWALGLSDSLEMLLAFKSIGRAEYLTRRPPESAWERTMSNSDIREKLLQDMGILIGGDDIEANMEWLHEQLKAYKSMESSSSISWERFAKKEPVEAIWWARQIPEFWFRESALYRLGQALAEDDPENAALAASQMTSQQLMGNVFYKVGYYLNKADPAKAKTWMNQVYRTKEPFAQTAAEAGITASLQGDDPVDDYFSSYYDDLSMIAFLAESLPDGTFREGAVHTAARHLSKFKPYLATMFAFEQLNDAGAIQNVLRTTLREWTEIDPESAAAWAQSLQQQSLRDMAIPRMAPHLAEVNGAAAISLTHLMTQGDVKAEVTETILNKWGESDQESLQLWASTQEDEALKQTAESVLTRILTEKEAKEEAPSSNSRIIKIKMKTLPPLERNEEEIPEDDLAPPQPGL